MALRINTNTTAMRTVFIQGDNNTDLETRLTRLSSGMRLNKPNDDAAASAILEGYRAQITGLAMGVRNAEMGSNLIQVAEGSLNEVNAILIRMRELAVASSSSTVNDLNREAIDAEANQLKQEIGRIARSTVYNDMVLLTGYGNSLDETTSTALTDAQTTGVSRISLSGAANGTYSITDNADGVISIGNGSISQTIDFNTVLAGDKVAAGSSAILNFDRLGISVTIAGEGVSGAEEDYYLGDLDGKTIVISDAEGGSFQVGADGVAEDRVEVGIADMRAIGLFLNLDTVSLGTLASARSAITQLDQAISNVAQARGDLGTVMNRLQHPMNFTSNPMENNSNSEAASRDADMALEAAKATRGQVLSQAATAMLADAIRTPQQAIGLLAQ